MSKSKLPKLSELLELPELLELLEFPELPELEKNKQLRPNNNKQVTKSRKH